MNILTWHVHGNYLYYLSRLPHNIFLPLDGAGVGDYLGRGASFPWGNNVFDVLVDDIPSLRLDCVIFQRERHYVRDQYMILSEKQRRLPQIFIEHDPPQGHPTNTRHCLYNSRVFLVHVTHFNALMWDSGSTRTAVVPHGVVIPEDVRYSGSLDRGIVAVNHLEKRGRRLGADLFQDIRKEVPLDLVGMDSEKLRGKGEISHKHFASFLSAYRFMFNPIRYTSLGLAVCEAMMIGLPVVGLATTEMSRVICNYETGYCDTDIRRLVDFMNHLIRNPYLARNLGENARAYAQKHFGIDRFVNDWQKVLEAAVS